MPTLSSAPARYTLNIRSFHPQKSFGYSGFWFRGDNRGFTTAPSNTITSRISHSLDISLSKGDIFDPAINSDPSRHPLMENPHRYQNGKGPQYRIRSKQFSYAQGQERRRAAISGLYWGRNYAMPFSESLEETTGITYVPAINVQYFIFLEANLTERYLDVIVEVTGDGFPNHEALLRGPHGKPVFLGGHVRDYTPALSLPGQGSGNKLMACAARLFLGPFGEFNGNIHKIGPRQRDANGNLKSERFSYRSIEAWNRDLTSRNPNAGRCMALESMSLEGCLPSW